jgi:hypothetical protein
MKIKRYKGYSVQKYREYKKRKCCPFDTYVPEKRVEIRKEHAVPFLVRVFGMFAVLGGWFSVALSGFVMSLKEFFKFKKKVEGRIRKGKVVELKVKRKDL